MSKNRRTIRKKWPNERLKSNGRARRPRVAAPPEEATEAEQMGWRLKTPEGKAFCGQRKATVETVFGIIKHVMGSGRLACGEWKLVKCAYNLKRMHALAT
jgi:hypothetical protein